MKKKKIVSLITDVTMASHRDGAAVYLCEIRTRLFLFGLAVTVSLIIDFKKDFTRQLLNSINIITTTD